jgi:hypothetical protein
MTQRWLFFGPRYLFSSDISHNTISNAGYSGVSLGWGWGTVFPAGCGNNTISYNRIYSVMEKLRDGGGIYVGGASVLCAGGPSRSLPSPARWGFCCHSVSAAFALRAPRSTLPVQVNGATNGSYPSLMSNNWVNQDDAGLAVFVSSDGQAVKAWLSSPRLVCACVCW